MGLSTHFVNEKRARQAIINKVGLGKIVYRTTQFDSKRNRSFIYEISTTAILTVRAADEPTLIITRYPARPSRLTRYWKDCPESILQIAVGYSQNRQTV